MQKCGLLAVLLLAGCATPASHSCLNFPDVKPFAQPNENGGERLAYTYASDEAMLNHLTCLADQGDRAAQLKLGQLYELGENAPQDYTRSAKLYERAAGDRPAHTAIYSPPVRPGGNGQMMFLDNPKGGPGLAEAKYRLGLLYIHGKGLAPDKERGLKLLREAAKHGFVPAQAFIDGQPRSGED